MGSVRTLRLVLVAVGIVGGVVLLASGATVVGAVVLVLALVRLALLVAGGRTRRMRGGHGGGGTADTGVRALAERELAVAARVIGVDAAQLRRDLASGRSIADVAAARGIARQVVVDAIVADASSVVRRRDRLTMFATRFVDRRGGPRRPRRS